MSKKKNTSQKPAPVLPVHASTVSELLALNMRNASSELQALLNKYGLELSVSHVIQLQPKRK